MVNISIGRLISFLFALLGVAKAMDTCTVDAVIGKMPTTFNNAPTNTSGLLGLFLNTNYASPYDGNVTAWDFCYYISVTQTNTTTIRAGVWRESGGYYTLVDDSLIVLPIPNPQLGFQFVCRFWALNESEAFEVQEGDIVGMYVDGTEDNNVVHILGMPANNEPNAGIIKSMDIVDIDNVSNSILTPANYTLYLVAILGGRNETRATCSPITTMSSTLSTTTAPTTAPTSTSYLPEEAVIAICFLGGIIVALTIPLIIIVVVVICRLCRLNRIKGSGPVLITRLNKDKRVAHKGPATSTTEPPGNLETDNNYELSQHETRPRKPLHPPPVLNEAELPTSADQGVVAFSPSGTQSPPQAVFDQQVRDGQDEATLNQPNLPSKNSHTKAQKVALLPKLDLRRSRSAAEVVNLFHTNTTQFPVRSNTAQPPDELLTTSSEYPYVVRTCEAIEKDRVIVGSLPNVLQFDSSNSKLRLRQEDENTSNDVVPYASVRVDGSDADFHDDEPTYSYTDSRELMQNGAINGKDSNFHYEEYPSEWMHVAQEHTEPAADSNNCQSPDYQDIDNFDDLVPTKSQSASALPSSNLASPLKISGAKENSTLPLKGKPKPPIQPRRKQTQTIVPSTPATQLSRIGTNNPSSADKIVNSADLNAQTPNKYMKLLPSTMDNFQVYTCLQNGTNDADLEQANPNQSSEN